MKDTMNRVSAGEIIGNNKEKKTDEEIEAEILASISTGEVENE